MPQPSSHRLLLIALAVCAAIVALWTFAPAMLHAFERANPGPVTHTVKQ